GALKIDPVRRRVTLKDNIVNISRKDFDILQLMAASPVIRKMYLKLFALFSILTLFQGRLFNAKGIDARSINCN
ncbi:hypothetical protein LEP1GSC072_3290, partial [Leptospira noguchii str. Bonito]